MRILLVSYFFPPYNWIGAVRTGKTAAYLKKFGHDVRVISAQDQPLQPSLAVELPEEQIVRTTWLDVNRPVQLAIGGRDRVASRGYETTGRGAGLMKRAGKCYKSLINYPDGQIGWLPYAVRAGEKLLRQWRPDVIFASALPATALLVARRLATRHGIPWVAEMRDMWVDDYEYLHGPLRRAVESRLERRTLKSASGLVTVSDPIAEQLRARYEQPVTVVLNGFDQSDIPDTAPPCNPEAPLRILYTGMIYPGRQDVEPLFQALRLMGEGAAGVRLVFYGRYLQSARDMAQRYGMEHLVEIHDCVSYQQSLRLQRESDVLLLLLLVDPRQRGVYTGKLFEYLGARRPILALGHEGDVATELLRQRQAGTVTNDPRLIADQLRAWRQEKQLHGSLPDQREEVNHGLSRAEQVRHLESFLLSVVGKAGGGRRASVGRGVRSTNSATADLSAR